ncbi:MAG: hypothetical protein KA419_03490 [Acidobacteria bacterium]|nr:hypothetical protein [Acidobacteriota bacterium]
MKDRRRVAFHECHTLSSRRMVGKNPEQESPGKAAGCFPRKRDRSRCAFPGSGLLEKRKARIENQALEGFGGVFFDVFEKNPESGAGFALTE